MENTFEAIDGAIDAKADYVEIDILLSKDSIPMVIHDENLTRLAGVNKNVYDLTAKELQSLTLSQNEYEGKIATLDEVIKYTDKKIKLLIEYKSHGHEKVDLVSRVMEVVEENQAKKSCIFQAMDFSYIKKMKKDYPDYLIGYTTYGSIGVLNTDKIIDLEVDFLSVEESMVTKKMIQECGRGWVSVYVWTVNDPLAVSNYVNDGVIGIITDLPKEARKAIE
uniref:GP-PDE domain-containing protein n=1 Tax=Candidatus Enterococcus clewellii TaxID=1834193 RepID=A0A242KCF3_9ENTE|nr:hypothetical protein A5888_000646 [Enterococcus sp. 9E7_DIV0242]